MKCTATFVKENKTLYSSEISKLCCIFEDYFENTGIKGKYPDMSKNTSSMWGIEILTLNDIKDLAQLKKFCKSKDIELKVREKLIEPPH